MTSALGLVEKVTPSFVFIRQANGRIKRIPRKDINWYTPVGSEEEIMQSLAAKMVEAVSGEIRKKR